MIKVVQLRDEPQYLPDIVKATLHIQGYVYRERLVTEEWLLATLQQMADSPVVDIHVATEDGQCLGAAIATVNQSWFSSDYGYHELFVYTNPGLFEMKASRVLLKLIKAMEARARDLTVHYMCIGTSTGVKTESYLHLLGKLGFTHFGTTLKKEFITQGA